MTKVPLAQASPIKFPQVYVPLIEKLLTLTLLAQNESGCKQSEKHLEQVNLECHNIATFLKIPFKPINPALSIILSIIKRYTSLCNRNI